MKTFETEKHNIPEGATHYSDENDGNYFLWCKVDINGQVWGLVDDESLLATVEKIEKPRTKTEYELLCNSSFNVWGLKDLLESGSLFYFINDEYSPVSVGSDIFAIEHFLSGHIYRKVETEIDERQEFINECMLTGGLRARDGAGEVYGNLYDSGKFKLVEK